MCTNCTQYQDNIFNFNGIICETTCRFHSQNPHSRNVKDQYQDNLFAGKLRAVDVSQTVDDKTCYFSWWIPWNSMIVVNIRQTPSEFIFIRYNLLSNQKTVLCYWSIQYWRIFNTVSRMAMSMYIYGVASRHPPEQKYPTRS